MAKSNHNLILDGQLKINDEVIRLDSARWFEWLETQRTFTFQDEMGHFTAQCEIRRNSPYWYAYRRINGKLKKVYLGRNEDLTLDRLQKTAASMQGEVQPVEYSLPAAASMREAPRIDGSALPVAKIGAPLLPRQMVTRERLTRMISGPITVITAPSGFGKSTLLNEWQQTCGFPVAWLSLDDRDNHLQRFWASVVSALQTIRVGVNKELLANLQSYPFSFLTVEKSLYDEITAQAPARLGLILDDFHYIQHSAVFDSLQYWIDHLPPNFQLIFSGHSRPPLSFGYLRARDQLREIDTNHLRFTVEEGIRFLRNYTKNSPLSDTDLVKLIQHNEGWAAGLNLTALALNNQEDLQTFTRSFSGEHIFFREFFLEAVLRHLPPETQDFLRQTSILKHLTGSLCDALTGRSDGAQMLAHLQEENIFIVRLEQEGWYRYHNLFTEMLQNQLVTRYPSLLPQLHYRAAQWFRDHAAPTEAIYHLLAIHAWEEAAMLIEDLALHELEQYGEDSRLLRWMEELPVDVIQKHRTLVSILLRLAATAYSPARVEQLVSQIKNSLQTLPEAVLTPDEKDVLAELVRFEQTWAKITSPAKMIESINTSESRWGLFDRLWLLKLDFPQYTHEVEVEITKLVHMAMFQKNLFVLLMAGGSLSSRLYSSGQLRKSEQIARQVVDFAKKQRGVNPETASIALASLAEVYLERNDIKTAEALLQKLSEVDPNPTSSNMIVLRHIIRAKIKISCYAPLEALQIVCMAAELNEKRPSRYWTPTDMIAQEAICYVLAGNLLEAERLMSDVDAADLPLALYTRAEIHLAKNELADAEKCLQQIIIQSPYGAVFYTLPLIYVRILLVQVYYKQKQVKLAYQMMIEVLRQAVSERFIRPFLLHPATMLPFLKLFQSYPDLSRENKAFVEELIQIYDLCLPCASPISPASNEVAEFSLAISISPRELEVLRLVNDGLSNRSIAEHLSISESTVKTHLSNLYFKLGVSNRFQAIARAKQMQLLTA